VVNARLIKARDYEGQNQSEHESNEY